MDIWKLAKTILKQPYWVIVFVVGAAMIAFPCVSYRNATWTAHEPSSWFLIIAGAALVVASLLAFAFGVTLDFWAKRDAAVTMVSGAGLDVSRVKDTNGGWSTKIGDCEIRVILGRLEDYRAGNDAIFVLPCNEYFDDHCVADAKGALGAYVSRAFPGRTADFARLVEEERQTKLGRPQMRYKFDNEESASFGAGRALLLRNPLNTNRPVVLVSSTTQRTEEGIVARISYLFEGMRELVKSLGEVPRSEEIVMPLLGAGRGGISAPLALVGLLLALAEAVRYGAGSQRLRKVTIVAFRRDEHTKPEVDPIVIRRALALIGQQD